MTFSDLGVVLHCLTPFQVAGKKQRVEPGTDTHIYIHIDINRARHN